MNKAYGTVQDGEIRLDRPVEWLNGTRVEVYTANGESSPGQGSPRQGVRTDFKEILETKGAGSIPDSFWPLSSEETALIVARMDAAPPVFENDAEFEAFEEFLRTSKAEQKEMVRRAWETEEPLF